MVSEWYRRLVELPSANLVANLGTGRLYPGTKGTMATTTSNRPVGPTAAPTSNPAGGPTITAKEASALLQSGKARMIDVREADEHRHERIAGASLHPTSSFDPAHVARPAEGIVTVVQCRSGKRGGDVTRRLLDAGHSNVVNLAGGIEAWKAAGLAVERGTKAPFPIMRQVQVLVGLLTLLGVALTVAVSPWFLVVPAFLGTGLTFAGLSGWCGMALFLGKMPWNRVS